ncbi:MAG: hypothetical protein Q4D98_03535 [Planctomycetia bacterium]|nr:hypothetical protein [Planctomycetia bacterium]
MPTVQNNSIQVSPYEGKTFRFLAYACDGERLQAADVSGLSYTVWQVEMGTRTAVLGHSNVAVPTNCILPESKTSSHTGKEYNVEHRISAAEFMPFPVVGVNYKVVYTFLDASGDKYTCEINCSCQ